MNNIFIIGNGFDLDLGLKTKYSDFANSKHWQQLSSCKGELFCHLKNKKQIEQWFDIEKELLSFAHFDVDYLKNNVGKFNPSVDRLDFVKIQEALCAYIDEQQNEHIKSSSAAAKVLQAVVNNGYFNSVYSFNYTDINVFARQMGLRQEIDCFHIHGQVANKSIILGVDEANLINGYEFLYKTMSPNYHSNNMFDDLVKSSEIVIFGLSFGSIDYTYFKDFFNCLVNVNRENNSKKYITIFTKDENSRYDIMNNLHKMNINLQKLYAYSYFQVIRTSEAQDKQFLDAFTQRLDKHSKRKNYENIRKVESFLY